MYEVTVYVGDSKVCLFFTSYEDALTLQSTVLSADNYEEAWVAVRVVKGEDE